MPSGGLLIVLDSANGRALGNFCGDNYSIVNIYFSSY